MKWDALKSRIQKAIDDPASDFHGYLFNEALSILVRERFMARAASSPAKDFLILKGGLLLTCVYTKQSRFTIDADITIKSSTGLNSLQQSVDSICLIELHDGFSFSHNNGIIMDADSRLYDGAQFQIFAKFGTNQKLTFTLDFGVGDIVEPLMQKLPVIPETSFASIQMLVYPPETIAAEKLQSCIEKADQNSRMKDYYDLYLLREIVDISKFNIAAKKTFTLRGTIFPGKLPEDNAPTMQRLWGNFLNSKQQRVIKIVPKELIEIMIAIREFYGTDIA